MEAINMGRPHKKTLRQTIMFIDNEGNGDGNICHSLPTYTRRKGRPQHNLSAAVEANRPNAKTH